MPHHPNTSRRSGETTTNSHNITAETDRPSPFIVGIAGGTASGKSTISLKIEEALADRTVLLMHMDAYFLSKRPRMLAPITGQDYEDHNHPDSFDLKKLVEDLDAHHQEGAAQVIIVEGLMTLHHRPLRERLDLAIYIDAPSDERIVRRLRRDMAKGRDYDEIAEFFLDCVRFRHQEFVEPSRWHADIVLNGSYPSVRGLAVVVEWIRQHS